MPAKRTQCATTLSTGMPFANAVETSCSSAGFLQLYTMIDIRLRRLYFFMSQSHLNVSGLPKGLPGLSHPPIFGTPLDNPTFFLTKNLISAPVFLYFRICGADSPIFKIKGGPTLSPKYHHMRADSRNRAGSCQTGCAIKTPV